MAEILQRERNPAGRFGWIKRMGVHEAYHQSSANRWVHWLCIPFELGAVIKLFSLIPSSQMDIGLGLVVCASALYIWAEVLAGLCMASLLVLLWWAGGHMTTGQQGWDVLISLGVFLVPFFVQTGLGHGVFEKGLDDTQKNIAELRTSKNLIPIFLVFFYHLVEILFALGYRPQLQARMLIYRNEELIKL